jgi:hypothetical protein
MPGNRRFDDILPAWQFDPAYGFEKEPEGNLQTYSFIYGLNN